MKDCLKCGSEIPNSIIIDGKKRFLRNRKFCLTCSPFNRHNTQDLRFIVSDEDSRTCSKCDTKQPASNFYRKNRRTGKRYTICKKCFSNYAVEKHRKIKERAIAYKGGKCAICGYSKCSSALVFHHIDPNEKDFGIAQDTSRNWTKIQAELDKCVMLCQNCHCEVHAGLKVVPLLGFEPRRFA